MKRFFQPNIDSKGRLVRVIWGLLLLAGAGVAFWRGSWFGWVLLASAAFSFFEAARSWCVVRACGIKTKY